MRAHASIGGTPVKSIANRKSTAARLNVRAASRHWRFSSARMAGVLTCLDHTAADEAALLALPVPGTTSFQEVDVGMIGVPASFLSDTTLVKAFCSVPLSLSLPRL